MELERADPAPIARAEGPPPAAAGVDGSVRDFERLAELLRLDAVGVAMPAGERDRPTVRWWGTPGCVLPDPVSDVLEGGIPGWIVQPLPDGGRVFAKLTKGSSARAPAVLQAVGPLLTAAPMGEPATAQSSGSVSAMEAALGDLRDDLGFETASLFVRGAAGWELLSRRGPVRAWHTVLDPSALEGT